MVLTASWRRRQRLVVAVVPVAAAVVAVDLVVVCFVVVLLGVVLVEVAELVVEPGLEAEPAVRRRRRLPAVAAAVAALVVAAVAVVQQAGRFAYFESAVVPFDSAGQRCCLLAQPRLPVEWPFVVRAFAGASDSKHLT